MQETQNKAGRQSARSGVSSVKKAIDYDKDFFVNTLPKSQQSFKDAYSLAKKSNIDEVSTKFRNLVEPFSKNGNSELPSDYISNLVKKGQTDKLKTLYDNIDD